MAIYENRTVILGIRVAQAICALIVLGLSAYVADWWRSAYNYLDVGSPSQVNFLIFCAVWALLALIYLILVPWKFATSVLHHKFAILGVEAVTMLFWFAGFIALAVFMTGRGCIGSVCQSARAAVVFAAFSWVLWAATTALATLHVLRNRGTAASRKGDPNLQVQEGV
ncbi:Putative Marvel domain-containing protein [Septoria linicola]|uniref:Marvel domain-containing protein n=1 Tax=Septoria linicola TaxID=215465 RepID=A0A9Q9ANP0_9PEZI|nr:putative Marvel domain-containing protein [Septoria linicola]USW49735.1 Putative Marvel domain-containing protein [Septoria linicola]